MSVVLTVNGVQYNYPANQDELWGEEATNWAVAITDAINASVVGGDIAPPTGLSFAIAETATNANVTNLIFDPVKVRSAFIEYYVYRKKGSNEYIESGILQLSYKSLVWTMSQESQGDDVNVTFSIDSIGQIKYSSTPVPGTGTYLGVMKFRARALPKEV